MKVSLTREAQAELVEAVSFYAGSGDAALGSAFAMEFGRSVEWLKEHPRMGAVWREPVRRLALRRFPYTIVYELRATELRIIALAHQRRRSGYWARRP